MGARSETLVVQNDGRSGFAQTLNAAGPSADSHLEQKIRRSPALWSCVGLLSIGGFIGVAPELCKLWQIWTTDPLRSIGAVILFTGIVLTLRVWRQNGWELGGTYWGFLLVTLAFAPVLFSERLVLFWLVKDVSISILPSAFPIYLYVSGIVLLFAGVHVWRRAWFPLGLLLLLQPVPEAVLDFCDFPLQALSAHIARWFAQFIGLNPGSADLLRLMFAPAFGMFIAPGCDGMRGAVTLAYGALIIGYLKRVSVIRWIIYVIGSFMLGHFFNLLRLCTLVVYYKISLGHPWLERQAEQADYFIGGLLFLVAALLLLWAVTRREGTPAAQTDPKTSEAGPDYSPSTYWRAMALLCLLLVAVAPGVRAFRSSLESLHRPSLRAQLSSESLNERIPSQIGAFTLTRAWQEQTNGAPVLEIASFQDEPSEEIEIGIWMPPTDHRIQVSLMTHGESPQRQTVKTFTTAGGKIVQFSTALYVDGVTDTLVGDTICSPSSCQIPYFNSPGIHLALESVIDHTTRGKRWVPIFFKAQAPHTEIPLDTVDRNLSRESQRFLSGLDVLALSRQFQ